MDPIAYAQRPFGHQLIISAMQRMCIMTRLMHVSTSIVALNRTMNYLDQLGSKRYGTSQSLDDDAIKES